MLDLLRGGGAGSPGAVAQQFVILVDHLGQLAAGISIFEAGSQIPSVEVPVDFGHLVGIGILYGVLSPERLHFSNN